MPRTTIFRSKLWLLLAVVAMAAGPFSAAVAQKGPIKVYRVKSGETLIGIARKLYGNAMLWTELYRLNKARIPNANAIEAGLALRLPARKVRSSAVNEVTVAAAGDSLEQEIQAEVAAKKTRKSVLPVPTTGSDSLFRRRRVHQLSVLEEYQLRIYRPLRRGEFYSSGFLSEGRSLALGEIVGEVTATRGKGLRDRVAVPIFSEVVVRPPNGTQYRTGDSIMVLEKTQAPGGFGDVIIPTGLLRVTEVNPDNVVAQVVSVFGPIRAGQKTMTAERFVPGEPERPKPITGGVSGRVVLTRSKNMHTSTHPSDILFLDVGRKDGVARGDIFEVRLEDKKATGGGEDEAIAVLQVVHVGERSATARVVEVVSPDFGKGAKVVQVAKLQ